MPAIVNYDEFITGNPKATSAYREAQSLIGNAAKRMGITPDQYLERHRALTAQEDKDRLEAMDPNKSKFMSQEEKMNKLNAWKNRRFRELGIGAVEGENYL
jgi:glutathione peroxidase-family protein